MNEQHLFILQVLSSFLVGGGVIALLTHLSERASTKTAGIILMLPSTTAVSFFYMGWVLSASDVVRVIPTSLMALSYSIPFILTFLFIPDVSKRKSISIVIKSILGSLIWLIFSAPLALYQFSSYAIGLSSCLLFTAVGQKLLATKKPQKSAQKRKHHSRGEKFIRIGTAGTVLSTVVIISKTVGPFWGGIISLYPAAALSTLNILSRHYNRDFLLRVFKNMPLGVWTLVAYVVSVAHTFPHYGFVLGSILSYLISLIAALLLTKLAKE